MKRPRGPSRGSNRYSGKLDDELSHLLRCLVKDQKAEINQLDSKAIGLSQVEFDIPFVILPYFQCHEWINCFLTIQNPERYDQARNMIQLLIYMGVFPSAYGIIDASSGHNYIFSFYKTAYQGLATGTFINRNHLAGYWEMIIPMRWRLKYPESVSGEIALKFFVTSGRGVERRETEEEQKLGSWEARRLGGYGKERKTGSLGSWEKTGCRFK